jgi:hypothetical protein
MLVKGGRDPSWLWVPGFKAAAGKSAILIGGMDAILSTHQA